MKEYRLHGQITVLASLILGITAVLAVVCVRSVIINVSLLRGNESVNLGVESVFSEYVRPLFEKYEILGINCSGQEEFKEKLAEYMSFNVKSPKEIQVDCMVKLGDYDGKIFAKQVVDYMKYRMPVDLLEKWKPILSNVGDTQTTKEVYEEYIKVAESAAEIDECVMKIVQQIDQIRGNHIIENMRRLDTELILINAVYYTPPMGTFKDAGYYKILSQILTEAQAIKSIMESFEGEFAKINELCEQLKIQSEEGIKSLDQKRAKLSKEIYDSYKEAYQEFTDYQKRIYVINQDELKLAVAKNIPVIENVLDGEVGDIKVTIQNLKGVSAKIHAWKNDMEAFDYSGFTHKYEGMSYDASESKGVLKKIKKLLTQGVLSYVVPKNTAVSGKKISFPNLSTKVAGIKEGSDYLGALNDWNMLEDLLFNEYVMEQFNCFTDHHSNETNSLDYAVEYILTGKNKDRDNLEEVVNQLTLMRSGFNLAWIIRDPKRRMETESYSALLLGFTGSPAIIRLGQYTLMSVWAYGEALNDVGILLNGGKVPLAKTGENWNTELMEVVALDIKKKSKNVEGLGYKDYLRILLYLSNRSKKYYRTMDMIEVGMKDEGYDEIYLSNMYCKSSGSVTFNFNGLKYKQKYEYSY